MSCIPGELIFTGDSTQITLISGIFNIKLGNVSDFTNVNIGFDPFNIHIDNNDIFGFINGGNSDALFIPFVGFGTGCSPTGYPSISWDNFRSSATITHTGVDTRWCPVEINCRSTDICIRIRECITKYKPEWHNWNPIPHMHKNGKICVNINECCRGCGISCDTQMNYVFQPYLYKIPIPNEVLIDLTVPGCNINIDHRIGLDVAFSWFLDVELGGVNPIYLLISIITYTVDRITEEKSEAEAAQIKAFLSTTESNPAKNVDTTSIDGPSSRTLARRLELTEIVEQENSAKRMAKRMAKMIGQNANIVWEYSAAYYEAVDGIAAIDEILPKDEVQSSAFKFEIADLFADAITMYKTHDLNFFEELIGWAGGSQQFLNFVIYIMNSYDSKEGFNPLPSPVLMLGIHQITINKLEFDIKNFTINIGNETFELPDIDLSLSSEELLVSDDDNYRSIKVEFPLDGGPLTFMVPFGTYPINLFDLIAMRIEATNELLIATNDVLPNQATETLINVNNDLISFLKTSATADWIRSHLKIDVDLFYRWCSAQPTQIPPLPAMNLGCANLQISFVLMDDDEYAALEHTITNMEINLPKLSRRDNNVTKPVIRSVTGGSNGVNGIVIGLENAMKDVVGGELVELLINLLKEFEINMGVASCIPLQ
jgi:hypothetical protein